MWKDPRRNPNVTQSRRQTEVLTPFSEIPTVPINVYKKTKVNGFNQLRKTNCHINVKNASDVLGMLANYKRNKK